MSRALLLFSGVVLLSACEAPPTFAGADARQQHATARIEGQVVLTTRARGPVVLFLYDAATPPPPLGSGRPVSFSVLDAATVFGDAPAESSGPFAVPYAFSQVSPGDYLVRAFVDGNADFIPWYRVTADVNQGDVGGGAVDPVTHAARVVTVGTDASGAPVAATGVPVSVSDLARVPVDRPVFSFGDAPVTLGAAPVALTLTATPVRDGVVHEAAPVFLARFIDDDGDGVPDDANGDGVPDAWPKVVVRKLAGDNPVIDENDLDDDGRLDATGADYEHLDATTGQVVPRDGVPDLVVLAAGFNWATVAPQLLDAQGRVKPTPTALTSLPLVVRPVALDAADPAHPAHLHGVPSGRYSVTVVQETGQTWRVPNELTPGVGATLGLPERASQGAVIVVP
jgi:hypothetical protein